MPQTKEIPDKVVPMPVEQIAVTPIPATESRTLKLSKILTWAAPIVGFLPDIIGFLLNLWMTDPSFAAAITDTIPMRYRVIVVALIIGIAQKYGQLRKDTSQPIIGSTGEAKAKENANG